MIKHSRIIILTILLVLMMVGCSGNSSNPVVPAGNGIDVPASSDSEIIVEETGEEIISQSNLSDLPLRDLEEIKSNRHILGTWGVTLDVDTLIATVNPMRNADQHYNVTSYVIPVGVIINSYDRATHVADVNVTIKNPLQYHKNVYDVRLIIITDGVVGHGEGHSMRNPDNWTELHDYELIGLDSNPFKAYNKHLHSSKRPFYAGMESTENVLVYCPEDNYQIIFVVDASYPGNCEEPYEIKNFQQDELPSDIGSKAWIQVDVFDWQNDVNEVKLRCPDIIEDTTALFTYDVDNTWKMNLENTTGAPAGEYGAMIFAKSENSGDLEMIDRVKITVTGDNPPNEKPIVDIDNCPAQTGESFEFKWTMSDDITLVEDLIVEIKLDDGPWIVHPDSPGATSYLWEDISVGSHTFKVRVTDDGDPALTSDPPASCVFSQSCTLPDAPENVNATDGTECEKVIVTWASVVDADYYRIYLNNDLIKDNHSNSPYEHINPPSGPLSYEVSAVNDCGEGPRGGPDTGYPKVAPEEAPTGVNATDGTYDDYVRITWNSVSGADSYKIYRNGQYLDTDTSSPYDDYSGELCQVYSYSVKAWNECGDGPMSSSDDGYRGHTPSVPTGVSASDGTYDNYVRISWNSVSGADYYRIYRNSSLIKDNQPSSPYNDTTANPGTHYNYQVSAVNDCGEGPKSDSDVGWRNCPLPAKVTGVTATDGTYDDYIRIDWNSVSGADYYKIYRNGGYLDTDTSSPYDDYSGELCRVYSYSVKAVNDCGESPMSSPDDGYRGHAPSAPTGFEASDGTYCDKIELTWDPVTGADTYKIYRNGSEIDYGISYPPYYDHPPEAGTHYSYSVKAVNDCGESPMSSSDDGYRAFCFSGYKWNVKDGHGGPGPNYWSSDNVWVDAEGKLHLRITYSGGHWNCAEVWTEESFGYKEYAVYLESKYDDFNENVVCGFFTYLDDNNEIDIEFSRWGNIFENNSWYVIQPTAGHPEHVHSFNSVLGGTYTNHHFKWYSDHVDFRSYHGHSQSYPLHDWTYYGSDIPSAGSEHFHINLWLVNGQPPSDGQEVELVIGWVEINDL